METEEYRKALLSRVRKVAPWGAEAIVRHIFAKNTSDKIKKCVNGSDAYIHALIDETKKSMESMEPRARSLGHEFPPPSWESQSQSSDTSDRTQVASVGQIGTSQLPSLSNAPDDGMCDFQDPSFNSQGQSSGTSDRTQAASVGQIGSPQLPSSSNAPDDGMSDFQDPSFNSQGQSSGTSDRTQAASVGQIGTPQLPSSSNAPDDGMSDFQDPSFNSQGQSSGTSDRTQAASVGQIGTPQLPSSSNAPDDGMSDFQDPSFNSQGQSSGTSDRTQAASVGQIGTSQLPSLSNAPDDGMCDFQDPSFNSQGQSSGTSIGLQSAPTGQTVTSQIPVDKSIGSKEHSQSSSVPRCSNGIGCLPSSSRPWPKICHFYMRHGFCKKDLWCEYSHGFGLSGKLEMEIRQLLWWIQPPAVEDLTWIYHECYKKNLPVGPIWDPHDLPYFEWYKKDLPVGPILDPHSSLPNLLQSLHTICLVPGRDGRDFVVLLEHYEACMSYSADLRDREVLKFEGPNQIYIRFSPASRSICPENVYHYFSKYGPVLFVTIPHQSSFGFVRFRYPGTVRLLLSEWNPQVPHFILGEAVRVSRYIPKGEAKLKNTAGKHALENGCDPGIVTEKSSDTSAPEIAPLLTNSQPSHPQMGIDPVEGGDATGSPDGDSANHSQPSHSQVEIDRPEGGEVLDGLGINPVEGGQVPGGMGIRSASARWLRRSSGRSTDR